MGIWISITQLDVLKNDKESENMPPVPPAPSNTRFNSCSRFYNIFFYKSIQHYLQLMRRIDDVPLNLIDLLIQWLIWDHKENR